MFPEEKARIKIDEQLRSVGWEVVTRFEYNRKNPSAVIEASMTGRKESDYLLFIDNKAIAVVEAKRAESNLDEIVAQQAENYTLNPQSWYGFWLSENKVPLVYLANGETILFKNMLYPDSNYRQIDKMHTPKEMLRLIGQSSDLGALPVIEKKGLRDCQYRAEVKLEASFKEGKKRALAVLATGAGKTYLASLASYRFLEYTPSTKRILFLADRNNLANQAKTEFSLFGQKLYLSPVLDLHNGYLVSYTISDRPVLGMVTSMLEKAFETIPDGTGLILHSDQGWQYQHKQYQRILREKGIQQSMSRKGNCLDNAVMENFFGLLKSELLYLQQFDSLEHFKQELVDYLDYYNNRRIKIKLKGLPPALHRQQALSVA